MTADGEITTPLVACPGRGETIDANTCAGCMRMRGLEWRPESGGSVHCIVSNWRDPDPRADFRENAARTTIHDVAGPLLVCVTADVSLERIRTLFSASKERAFAVVDEDGKLVGLLSRTDLARAPSEGTVADVMTPCVHALPEDAPLSYAISLLAYEDLGQVPLVSREGTVTGLCHARDILRWCAAQLGYAEFAPHDASFASG